MLIARTYLGFWPYSWNNLLLIAFQRPDASHVAGFHTWRKFNRFVRKGAKGIAIFAPMVSKKNAKGEDTEDEQTRLFGFRTAYIFDIADTDGADKQRYLTPIRTSLPTRFGSSKSWV